MAEITLGPNWTGRTLDDSLQEDDDIAAISAVISRKPEFLQALKAGKEVVNAHVERALYDRAVGYSYDSEKIFQHQGHIIRAQTVEHVPPDVKACIFWLKNRQPGHWKDIKSREVANTNHMSLDEERRIARAEIEEARDSLQS